MDKGSVRGGDHPPWLQALAAFAGAAFKKHNIELTALLQFVANRLKAQQRYISLHQLCKGFILCSSTEDYT